MKKNDNTLLKMFLVGLALIFVVPLLFIFVLSAALGWSYEDSSFIVFVSATPILRWLFVLLGIVIIVLTIKLLLSFRR